MTTDLNKRHRQVNVEAMSAADADRVGFELGKKITEITERAAEEVNKLTQIYGITAKVAIQLLDPTTGETETVA